MKEKRHVCFGGALTKGKKLKYITYPVLKSYASQASVIFVKHNEFFLFVCEGNTNQLLQQEKPKKQ